jgi:hypothetical protein
MNRFNDWLADKLGSVLSSMTFFYVCVLLDLIELVPVIQANSIITWCTFLSQGVIQLVALPILGAQQKLTHKHMKTQHEHHAKVMEEINKIHNKLK